MDNYKTLYIKITNKYNKRCKYEVSKEDTEKLNLDIIKNKILKAKEEGYEKVIFIGGEPFLFYNDLLKLIIFSKKKGYITSVTTNGSLITRKEIDELSPYLDEINILVDSISSVTNISIGRFISLVDEIDYYLLIHNLKQYNISINIHTTVCKFNQYDNLQSFIHFVQPGYWLIKEVDQSSEIEYDSIKADSNNFKLFQSKHIYKNIIIK